jgi:hypothetical protein
VIASAAMARSVSAAARNRIPVDRRLVLECDRPDRRRQREHDVEVGDGQQPRHSAEDVRHLQAAGQGGRTAAGRDYLQRQPLERARGSADGDLPDVGVTPRQRQVRIGAAGLSIL